MPALGSRVQSRDEVATVSKIRIACLCSAAARARRRSPAAAATTTTPPSSDRRPARSRSTDCTPDTLETKTRGHADGRHRQARLPAVLRGQRPDQRQGLRERRRLRDRRPARLRRGRRRVDGRAVQRLLRPGAEGLRLRRQPDLDHAEARRAGRLLRALLRGRAGDRRAEGLRARRRRPRSPTSPTPTIGVQIGTTSLDAVNEEIQPSSEPAGLRHLQRRRHRAQERPGRRGRRRRADRASS